MRQPNQTARVRTEATIESKEIGLGPLEDTYLGDTRPSPSLILDAETGTVETRIPEVSGGATLLKTHGCCQTQVRMIGSGKHPFTPPEFTPSIDYFVTWTLTAVGPNRISVKVEGYRKDFPAYEAVIDWSVAAYKFKSPYSGPNWIDLTTLTSFSSENAVEVAAENDCAVLKLP